MGEKISNGGWEDGWTDWTQSGFTRSTSSPHGGTWSIWSYSTLGEAEQTLATEVAVNDVASFTIWTKPTGYFGGTPNFTLIITYTDTSSSTDSINMGTIDVWNEIDLKGYLVSGKTIEKVKIQYQNSNWTGWFDDISLMVYGLYNSGGDVENISKLTIRWFESQLWDVATRDVPMRSAGTVIDDAHYYVGPKTIKIICRLSDAEKTQLEAIIDANVIATFNTSDGVWSYQVMLEATYNHDNVIFNGTARPWLTTITMTVKSGGKV